MSGDIAEVEDEIGVDLDDKLFFNHEGEPMVVANTVDVSTIKVGARRA